MTVRDVHSTALATSTALSSYYVSGFITPLEVLTALARARIPNVLVGTHALGGWMSEPRTSPDVDILVGARHHNKAVRTLRASFPALEENEQDAMTRLRDKETKVARVDVVKADRPLLRAVLRHTCTFLFDGVTYQIPTLEMALALKFSLFLSRSWSDTEKYMDAHDLLCMAMSNPHIDEAALAELGDLVCPGGGPEIVKMVQRVRAGGKLDL